VKPKDPLVKPAGFECREKGGVCGCRCCSVKPNDPRDKPVGFFESAVAFARHKIPLARPADLSASRFCLFFSRQPIERLDPRAILAVRSDRTKSTDVRNGIVGHATGLAPVVQRLLRYFSIASRSDCEFQTRFFHFRHETKKASPARKTAVLACDIQTLLQRLASAEAMALFNLACYSPMMPMSTQTVTQLRLLAAVESQLSSPSA